jgi:hypothetical protein
MNKLSWGMLLLFLFFLTSRIFAEGNSMKIFLLRGDKIITLYEGIIDDALMDDIKKSRRLWLGPEKTGIVEGRYCIVIDEGNRNYKYSVINNVWIYDETNKKYLRCSILADLRGYFFDFLKREGYLDNLIGFNNTQ